MALQAHPLHAFVKLAKVVAHRQAGLARLVPVADGDVQAEVFVPAQKGVAHQAGDVVGDGAVHGVLEVEHAQGGAGRRGHHQITRHEIAVHVNAGPGQVVLNDAGKGFVERAAHLAPHFSLHGHAPMAVQVPVRKKFKLALEQGAVIRRQHAGTRSFLPVHQRVHGLQVQAQVGLRVFALDDLHHGVRAQVAQQHEAVRGIPVQHLGHAQLGIGHQTGHLYKGQRVLFVRRRVHDDAAAHAVGELRFHPKVAAKAGIGRGAAHGVGKHALA